MRVHKKIRYKDLDKTNFKIYLIYLDGYIGRLLKEADGKEIFQKIIKSFTKDEQKIFWEKLYLFILVESIKEFRESRYFKIRKEMENKCVKEGRYEELRVETKDYKGNSHIRHLFNKQERDKLWQLTQRIQQSEKVKEKLYTELETIPKDRLLPIFGKVFSAIADWQNKQDLIQLIKIRSSWFQEIKELSLKPEFKNINRKDAKTKKSYIIELIKILTGENLEGYKSKYLKSIDKLERLGFYERRYPLDVDLDEELDLKRLNYDRNRYWIETKKMHLNEFNNIVEDGFKRIRIRDENSWQDLSLREYYQENIEKFSSQTLRSKDLLDQIFVIYVIKRAQNGDGKALQKLYECYIETARGVAVKFIKTKQEGKPLFNLGGKLDYYEVESVASSLLWTLLRGDLLEELPFFLKSNQGIEFQLTRRIDKKILEMYNRRFLQLEAEVRYFWNQRKRFRKKIKNLRYNLKKSVDKDNKNSIANYLSKICTFSLKHLRFLDVYNFQTSISFDPYVMLSASQEFDKSIYIPTKNSNLTTWLFGDGEKWRGVFWQRLNDWYKSVTYTEYGKRLVKKEDLASPEGIISYTPFGKRKSQSKEEFLTNISDEESEDIISL